MALVQMFHVSKSFGAVDVLVDVDFRLNRGEFVCLTGATGSGKSTLLKLIYFEERPTEGQTVVEGFLSDNIRQREIPQLRRRIGVLYQDFKLLRERTAYENVSFALHVTGAPMREIRRRVTRALTQVGLGHKRNAYPGKLSGGEQQRVALARAIVNDPVLLIADEPTGNLDQDVGKGIVALFEKINQQGTAVVMATHNLGLIEDLPYRRLHLEGGRLIELEGVAR